MIELTVINSFGHWSFAFILTDDNNRVVLRPIERDDTDYINASYIDVRNILLYILYEKVCICEHGVVSYGK